MAILDDTRADWNARPPLRTRTAVPWADRIGVSWHWIGPGHGPSATGAHQKCLDQVRDWQAQHQANGWKDIGYNALVCQHARAIEGRGLIYSGSHSPGVNYEHVGIQLMVGDASPFPSDAMIARAVRLRADVGALGKNIRRDWGHRDDPDASTSCPGNAIAAWVHAGGPTKTATTTSPEEDDDMPSLEEIAKAVWDYRVPIDGNTPRPAGIALGRADLNSWRAAKDDLDEAALAEALAANLPAGTVTQEQLAAALRSVLGSLDDKAPEPPA